MPSGHIFSLGALVNRVAPASPHSRRNLRPDIQGLRMLAVVAVILDHLLHWPAGGFVGVDVFFVISGFLITGILLREHERTGHISFVGFYRRRIKRIVPAATIVLVATVLVSRVAFNAARANQTFWDAVWSFFFVGNWRFAVVGTDYFQADGPLSPLQHFWSLSVEEQFYFVWPWLMLAVLAIAGARGSLVRRRTLTGVLMALIVIVTFVWSIHETATNPTVAYFSTFSRAWELGAGALIAIASPWWSHIVHWLRPVLGWGGLLGIVASYFVIDDTMSFPAPWALLPVLSTALVIAAGTGGEQRFLFPLTNPVSFYIGNISYSLYLWHFPVIVIGAALITDASVFYAASVALIVALGVLSYHLIEVPIQRSPLFETFPGRTRRSRVEQSRARWARWHSDFEVTFRYGALATAVLVAAIMGGLLFSREASIAAANLAAIEAEDSEQAPTGPSATATPTASAEYGPEVTDLQSKIAASVVANAWPQLSPTIDDVIGGPQVPKNIGPCGQVSPPPLSDCTFNPNGTHVIVLAGDSTSLAYTQSFLSLAEATDAKIIVRGMFGCPFVDIAITNDAAGVEDACPGRNTDTIALIKETRPDAVIITDTYERRTHRADQTTVSPSEWSKGVDNYVGQLAPYAGQVILLAPPPASANVANCYTPQSTPTDCMTNVTDQWLTISSEERRVAESHGGIYIDSRPLFCQTGMCPAFVGTTPVKLDLVHITSAYAEDISPPLLELMRSAGLAL